MATAEHIPNRARFYIASVAVAGLALLAAGVMRWESANPLFYLTFLALALLGATRKIRLPRMTGTVSLNFLFILVGVVEFGFAETLVMGCSAALLQSIWKPRRQPRPVQLVFNVATMAISITAAYWGAHIALAAAPAKCEPLLLIVATSLLLVTNTGLVAGVLALTEAKPFGGVWKHCYACVFPYFLVGGALAGFVCASSHSVGWQYSLLVLPLAYLLYLFYQLRLERVTGEQGRLAA